jgi:hypothetical protein
VLQHESGDKVDALASELMTTKSLGKSFVMVRQIDEHLLVVVGGKGGAEVVRDEHVSVLSCPEGVAVTEYRLPGLSGTIRVTLGGDSSPAHLPLGTGIVPAALLQLRWESDVPAPAPVLPTDAVTIYPEEAEPETAWPKEPPHPVSEETISPPSISAETVTTSIVGSIRDEDLDRKEIAAPSRPEPDSSSETGYDFLFGHTVNRSVTDAAIHAESTQTTQAQEDWLEADVVQSVSELEPQLDSEARVESASIARTTEPDPSMPAAPTIAKSAGMIDEVPWAARSADSGSVSADAEPSGSRNPLDDLAGEDDGAVELTISRAKQREILQQLSSDSAQSSPSPVVHAVRCPAGHPNPAHAGECRICAEPIEDQSPVTLARPILGVLRFSTGDVITLDRGVLIGRKPSATRFAGNDRPHVVKLPSPEHDVSRNHLEISLDDWHVLVTDLNSTNGTVVTRPGREPERLRPDQAMMIEPGSVVDLAEVVSFTFEATE